MLRYYSRFLRQTCKNVIKDGVPQVIGAVLAFAILILQIRFGAVPHDLAWPNVWSIAWPYSALCAALVAWAALRAPVQLDEEANRRADHAEHRMAELQAQGATPKVSPWEHEQRRLVNEKMRDFSPEEQEVMRHILHHGEVSRGSLVSRF